MNNVTLITAFFDINRENWNSFKRSNELYLDFFAYWSELKNDLIVYVDSIEMKEEVEKLRKNIVGFKTTVVLIDDIASLNPTLFNSLNGVEFSSINHFRYLPNNPESRNPIYNYVMMMKYQLLLKAIDDYKIGGPVGWIDFGFDHGGENYKKEYFDFTLKYDSSKITLFSLEPIKRFSILDTILKMETVMQGSLFVGPSVLIKSMCDDAIEAQLSLNKCDIMDDDQITLLMAYYNKPSNFYVVDCDWHTGLFYLKESIIKKSNPKMSLKERMAFWMRKNKYKSRINKYICKMKRPH